MRISEFFSNWLRTASNGKITGRTVAVYLVIFVALIVGVLLLSSPATPKELRGRWITGTSAGTNYWNPGKGSYAGSGRGSSQLYEFDGKGGYKYFMFTELRTYGLITQAETSHQGTVEFNGDRFVLHPTAGYSKNEGGVSSDHVMTADELTHLPGTYRWWTQNASGGDLRFVVVYENGGNSEFRHLAADAPTKP